GEVVEKKVKVAEGAPRPWDLDSKFEVVGRKHPRVDGLAKASGRAKYTYDVNLPGMLYARLLRAPIAAGKLASIDVSAAKTLEGGEGAHEVGRPRAVRGRSGRRGLRDDFRGVRRRPARDPRDLREVAARRDRAGGDGGERAARVREARERLGEARRQRQRVGG